MNVSHCVQVAQPPRAQACRCRRCGRALTSPQAAELGYGAACWKKAQAEAGGPIAVTRMTLVRSGPMLALPLGLEPELGGERAQDPAAGAAA